MRKKESHQKNEKDKKRSYSIEKEAEFGKDVTKIAY